MEGMGQQNDQDAPLFLSSCDTDDPRPQQQQQQHDYINASLFQQDSRASTTPGRRVTTPQADSGAEDADAMTGIVGYQSQSLEFFGSSNASLFMRQIQSIIEARWGRDHLDPPLRPPSRKARQETDRDEFFRDPQVYSLPPRRVADNFLSCYWDQLWAVFPIHERLGFEKSYDSLWTDSPIEIRDEMIFYTMLNLVFGLGSQFSDLVRPDDRKAVGQVFWTRAQTLFNPQVTKAASLAGVQCLLLMAIFLQSSCDSYRCWMVTGSAIRMAQSLGLHLPETSRRISNSETDCEIARRLWHACVFLDR